MAWVDCRVFARYPAGTHTVVIGEVVASGVPADDVPPLLYWRRGYRELKLHEPEAESTAAEIRGPVLKKVE
jgi:flavin reductase (DIM6/NTAB) family NADH-FMN oxidoreductase RutF